MHVANTNKTQSNTLGFKEGESIQRYFHSMKNNCTYCRDLKWILRSIAQCVFLICQWPVSMTSMPAEWPHFKDGGIQVPMKIATILRFWTSCRTTCPSQKDPHVVQWDWIMTNFALEKLEERRPFALVIAEVQLHCRYILGNLKLKLGSSFVCVHCQEEEYVEFLQSQQLRNFPRTWVMHHCQSLYLPAIWWVNDIYLG